MHALVVPGRGQKTDSAPLQHRDFQTLEYEEEKNKAKNLGITSVDRSTRATLSTYNPWIQVSRLQKIYHFQSLKL